MSVGTKVDEIEILKGRLAVRPYEALLATGISTTEKSARNTARNYMARDRFPFPTLKVGKTVLVRVADIMSALGLAPAVPTRAGTTPSAAFSTLHPLTIACDGHFKPGRPPAEEVEAAKSQGFSTVAHWRIEQVKLLALSRQ